jgi:hypothetical protein
MNAFRSIITLSLIVNTGCAPIAAEFAKDDPSTKACAGGRRIGLWLDQNKDGSTDGEKYLGSFAVYKGTQSAAENYNYYSASAHPLVGPTPSGFKTTVFFYEGPDGLAFNFFSNVDAGGSTDNIVEWNIKTIGNDAKDDVILSDDNIELSKVSSTSDEVNYEGRFHYYSNTDGGVIGPFHGDGFQIAVQVLNIGDVIDAGFYSSTGEVLALGDGPEKVSSFIVKFEPFEDCF